MKKLVALVLALVMTLGLCSVTAFAGTIDSLTLEYSQKNYKTALITWDKDNGMDLDHCPVKLWGKGKLLYGIQAIGQGMFYYYNYIDDEVIGEDDIDWLQVDTAQYLIGIMLEDDTFAESFRLKINGKDFETGDVDEQAIDCYYMSPNRKNLTISLIEEIGNETIWDCETLAKGVAIAAGITVVTVGTIHTVKAIKNYKAEKAAAAEAAKIAEMPMVAMGSSGDAVTTLQTELNAQGYDCGEVDGIFGQNTLNAVIAFQTANGLAADGIVGELTWGALL